MKILGIDTETTGLDPHHGTSPFIITTCSNDGRVENWSWEVEPETRKVLYEPEELEAALEYIFDADVITFHNAKYDMQMLDKACQDCGFPKIQWEWEKIHDTTFSAHLLASSQLKNLTTQVAIYLHTNIAGFEKKLADVCNKARSIARRKLPSWRIAEAGLSDMPSMKGKKWKADMWIPKMLCLLHPELLPDCEEEPVWHQGDNPLEHPWLTCVEEYATGDSASAVCLFEEHQKLISERKLEKHYEARRKLMPVLYHMEERGITVDRDRLVELTKKYKEEVEELKTTCINIARTYKVEGPHGELMDYELDVPKTVNNSLRTFVFDVMKLPVVSKSKKTGEPSMNKDVIEAWSYMLRMRSKEYKFVKSLRAMRQRATAVGYLESYLSYAVTDEEGIMRLFASLKAASNNTLRMASERPNEQNVSKKQGFNLRYAFGPSPGRVWISMDAQNIELRIPAYEAGEQEMINLFEKPNEPPYFGSNHLLVFDVLHHDKWDHSDPEGLLKAKKKYASTWYTRVKNGNFAVQYGAMEESGTADRAYGVEGAQALVMARFSNIEKLNQTMISHANKHGYVPTMINRTIDSERGYPIQVMRTFRGKVKPTQPLNYHVQSTAMMWMTQAMLRCHEYLERYNSTRPLDQHIFITMQVHDEMVFDCPLDVPRKVVRTLQDLMALGGKDIGVPIPVGVEFHPVNWSESMSWQEFQQWRRKHSNPAADLVS